MRLILGVLLITKAKALGSPLKVVILEFKALRSSAEQSFALNSITTYLGLPSFGLQIQPKYVGWVERSETHLSTLDSKPIFGVQSFSFG
jgi:hypothetical protein